ncbi:MAG: malto-oligosyltrehalose synthase [Cyanobacteria bacterium J06621_11]
MRIPSATYRLQFTPDFGFNQAKEIVPYLAQLGISDIYASPIFMARSGSQHGYDVVDQNRLNPELGTAAEYEALVDEARSHNLGWLQDIVPNHMAFSNQNPYLMDALEHGPDSDYSDTFDIDWMSYHDELNGQVLAPMLGSDYRECLQGGELQLGYTAAGLAVNYYGLRLPIRLESYADFFGHRQERLAGKQAELGELLGRIDDEVLVLSGEARSQKAKDIKQQLWALVESTDEINLFVEENLAVFNGEAGKAESFELLDALLGEQFYQLSHWKVASERLNYRRFFTINELISLNAQHPHVFGQTHGLIQRLVKEEKITGLRVDHIDGLYDPLAYLRRLKEEMLTEGADNVYTTVEKILEAVEKLPNDWPIQGTSGYDFLTYINRLYCQQESKDAFSALYEEFTGLEDNYEKLFLAKKRLLAESELVGDIDNLAQLLRQVAVAMGETASEETFFAENLRSALKEVMIAFPVYRSYISAMGRSEKDEYYIREAVQTVKSHLVENETEKRDGLLAALSFIEKLLLLEDVESLSEEVRAQRLHFIMRMQQFTGPLMAKGIEDTLFYVYNRFTGLNEVGGAPGEFGLFLEEFHAFNGYQQENWPHNLNASSTHDTKRSEDVRSRLHVLTEMPEVWGKQVNVWREMTADKKQAGESKPIPTANDEYFLYQTLVGAYPFDDAEFPEFKNRVQAYVVKAGREAKENTNWTNIDEGYERGYAEFIDKLLGEEGENPFLESLREFQASVQRYGIYNSLSQLLMRLASPGVPDFYQGSELWDLSLVDPDNRRPVDYDERFKLLKHIQSQWRKDPTFLIEDLINHLDYGWIKLFVVFRGLAARKEFADVFANGDYTPLQVTGAHADRVIAFSRQAEDEMVIAIAPRFFAGLVNADTLPVGRDVWDDTAVELAGVDQFDWGELLTNSTVEAKDRLWVGDVCQQLPVALLIGKRKS